MNKVKKWEILEPTKKPQTIDQIFDLLLKHRGITTEKERKEFLHPQLENITIESVALNKEHLRYFLTRLQKAVAEKELVVVFGDYDVDGISGTAILWETLVGLGFKVMPYIPHRVEEGYGLSKIGIANIKAQMPDVKLIVTVDNGIVAHEAVDFAKKNGIDVVITDHHVQEDKKYPDAVSILHTTRLCGAGIAWLLSKELQKEFGGVESTQKEDVHLELAALATIADLVPLTGANRAIVAHGLKKLSNTKRCGLLELYSRAAVNISQIGVYEVGYIIGPRLNAAGRIESAMDSLRLLCTRDPKRAKRLAEQLDLTNQERQKIMLEAFQHASISVRDRIQNKKVIIIAHETYEEGIIGLVAGRLVEEFHKPAIVIAKGEKKSKGSVRSVSGFNIIEFLRSKSELFINVGGHPMAAGFTIETEKLAVFQQVLEELADTVITDELLQPSVKVDMEISLNNVTPTLYSRLQALTPFGIGNPEPVFLSKHVLVREKTIIGKDGKHLRMILQDGEVGKVFEGIAFGMGDRSFEIQEEGYIDIVYAIDENKWNGNKRLQLKIKDFRK